jgi:quaternary ammonium compound-resistance protein SugE
MSWVYILIAGFLEIVWVIGLKYSHGFTILIPSIATIIVVIFSFYLLSKALDSIPIGTGYAIFTGIGTVGTVITGAIFWGETITPWKVFFVTLIIVGIIGLRVIPEEPKELKNIKRYEQG